VMSGLVGAMVAWKGTNVRMAYCRSLPFAA
jgi:hypothetical protein